MKIATLATLVRVFNERLLSRAKAKFIDLWRRENIRFGFPIEEFKRED